MDDNIIDVTLHLGIEDLAIFLKIALGYDRQKRKYYQTPVTEHQQKIIQQNLKEYQSLLFYDKEPVSSMSCETQFDLSVTQQNKLFEKIGLDILNQPNFHILSILVKKIQKEKSINNQKATEQILKCIQNKQSFNLSICNETFPLTGDNLRILQNVWFDCRAKLRQSFSGKMRHNLQKLQHAFIRVNKWNYRSIDQLNDFQITELNTFILLNNYLLSRIYDQKTLIEFKEEYSCITSILDHRMTFDDLKQLAMQISILYKMLDFNELSNARALFDNLNLSYLG